MKNLILTFISFFMLLSCNNNDDSFTPQNITPILVGKGELTTPFNNVSNNQNIVIQNQTDWDIFLQILSVSGNLSTILLESNINFNSYDIIAIIDIVRPTGGNAIDITNIIENLNNVTVTISWLNEGDATIVTQPIHIVKIPKTNKPIIFQ